MRRARVLPTCTGSAVAGAVLALLLAAGSFPAAAQSPAETEGRPTAGGPDVVGSAGFLAPLANLTRDPEFFASEVSSSFSAGGSLTYWLPGGLGFGVHGVWAPANLNALASEFTGAIPNDLGGARYLAGTFNVLYRLDLGGAASIVEPYGALGAGVRDLSVDRIAREEVGDGTDPVLTGALGVRTSYTRNLFVQLEVRDLVSRFESAGTGERRLQNDVLVLVGLGFRP